MSEAAVLLQQADDAFRLRDYARAGDLYVQAAASADAEKEIEVLVEAQAQAARTLLIRERKEDGRAWLERARTRARPDLPLAWSRFLGVRGRFEWKDGDLPAATRTFGELYDFCMQRGLHSRAVDAAHMVAITGTLEQQLEWGRKGIRAAEASGDEGWLGPLWNNLGWTLDNLGRHEETLDALRRARHYHWKLGDEQAKLVADWAVGHALRMTGRLEEALAWIRPTLAWAERIQYGKPTPDAAEWVGHASRELAELEYALGRTREALALFRRARAELTAANMPEWDAAEFARLQKRVAEVEAATGAS
jgi:tetratricopeptide (TPR) repeat protein